MIFAALFRAHSTRNGSTESAILGNGSERGRARPHFIFIRQLLSAGLIILGAGSKSRNGLYPHWLSNIKFALLTTILVPEAGLEPARFTAEPFEGCVSTNSTTRAYSATRLSSCLPVANDLRRPCLFAWYRRFNGCQTNSPDTRIPSLALFGVRIYLRSVC